jgi:thiamine biosynthesis lipoprotein ApbE
MSESPAESSSSDVLWDALRYIIVAIASGILIWYYFFYTPINYVSRVHTGKTMEIDYIVKVPRFPELADWNKIAVAIQDRLDGLEQNMSAEDRLTISNEVASIVQESLVVIDHADVAKGFAVDCVAELLEEQKIADYFIEIDGRVRCKGKKTKEKDWLVGIEKPAIESSNEFSGLQQVVPLHNQSLATQGAGFSDEVASVTVIAETCVRADAWATALLALGAPKGTELAQQHGIAVLFLLRNGSETVEVPSQHWQHRQ